MTNVRTETIDQFALGLAQTTVRRLYYMQNQTKRKTAKSRVACATVYKKSLYTVTVCTTDGFNIN